MSDDAKPYTHSAETMRSALQRIHRAALGESDASYMSIPADPRRDADLILARTIDEVLELREALERVAKERDAALAACGEMRAALEAIDKVACRTTWSGHPEDLPEPCVIDGEEVVQFTRKALASDAGRGWVAPEAFDAALREVAADVGATGRLVVPKRQLDAIVAAAKAKHGGGR